jgi:hypothetical protein
LAVDVFPGVTIRDWTSTRKKYKIFFTLEDSMHTIRQSGNLWTVGFSAGGERWLPIRDFPATEEREALEMVSFLNGGEMPRWWRPL